jgi:hypothetical protein
MTSPGNTEHEQELRALTVRWKPDDWRAIEEATKALNERDHSDLTPTDFIRMASRKLAAEIVSAAAA